MESAERFEHRRALPIIGTKPSEETWIDFLRGWSRAKYPKGGGPMAEIFAKALKADIPKVAERFEQQQLRLLVSLCRELQWAGTGHFIWPSERLPACLRWTSRPRGAGCSCWSKTASSKS
jgi:hypothetical protein